MKNEKVKIGKMKQALMITSVLLVPVAAFIFIGCSVNKTTSKTQLSSIAVTKPVTTKPVTTVTKSVTAPAVAPKPVVRNMATALAPPTSTKSEIPAYVPPDPTPPNTYLQQLATMIQDKDAAYTLHAIACDRAALYTMFTDEAKFYIINATHTWFWGDGTSSYGSEQTHVYARGGLYTVGLNIDIGFRGGSTCKITAEAAIEIAEPKTAPVFTFSDPQSMTGDAGGPAVSAPITVTNTGGRTAVVRPVVVKDSGTIEDISWITITPADAVVVNNGVPVVFTLTYDWSKATPGSLAIHIHYDYDTLTSGWHVIYKNSTVIPPTM